MPLTLKALQGKVNTMTMDFGGETVHITYKSGVITPAWEEKWKGKEDGIYHQAEELIVDWDVMKDATHKYPTTLAAIKELPLEFVVAVVSECARDIVPNARTSRRSEDSSFGV
jgi:hypothetical protein